MTTQGFQSTMIGSAKLLVLVLRHIAAPLVSFVVSYVTAFVVVIPLAFVGMSTGGGGQALFNLLFPVVGYCGVISGARCLPPVSRRAGSIILTFLGLIYFSHFVASWGNQVTDEGKLVNMNGPWSARLVLVAIGGLLATLTIWYGRHCSQRWTALRLAAQSRAPFEKDTVEETGPPCVRCGKRMPEGSRICPQCDWTQPV